MSSLQADNAKAEKYATVGKPALRIDGNYKVSGKALYTGDNLLPGMIWGKVLRSPYPHARIVRIDTARARAYPGVLAVLTAADIPPVLTGRRLRDMPMLARDRVRFIGEKVAVVAAEDRNVAEEAAQLIEVEYEELPAVFDPLVAITEGAPLLHEGLKDYKGLPNSPRPHQEYSIRMTQWLSGRCRTGLSRLRSYFRRHVSRPSMFINPIWSRIRASSPSTGDGHDSCLDEQQSSLSTPSKVSPRPSVCPRKKSSSMSPRSAATSAAKAR